MVELYWRSLMTLLFWEWHLIPWWPLRSKHLRSVSITASQRLGILRKSWRVFHMIDRFLGDAFGVLSCQFWSTVLLIVDPWQSFVCFIRSGVKRCTLLMVLYLDRMCQCWLHAVLWSHIGTLMRTFYKLAVTILKIM